MPKRQTPFFLKTSRITSKLGPLISISDGEALLLLDFVGHKGLEKEIQRLKAANQAELSEAEDAITLQIRSEVNAYLAGKLRDFTTPIKMQTGSCFQKSVWAALREIPYGMTLSYEALAHKIGRPTSWRAVANANGANRLALIIPCHRVIHKNGRLGGYGGGVPVKELLLNLEKN